MIRGQFIFMFLVCCALYFHIFFVYFITFCDHLIRFLSNSRDIDECECTSFYFSADTHHSVSQHFDEQAKAEQARFS